MPQFIRRNMDLIKAAAITCGVAVAWGALGQGQQEQDRRLSCVESEIKELRRDQIDQNKRVNDKTEQILRILLEMRK